METPTASPRVVPSHYLVRVRNLPAAVADFRRAGFTVTWGGDPATAYNAFVYFPRGGFIELFDLPIQA